MFLTATNVAHYLMARGHLDAESIVDGSFAVRPSGGRNRNFQVRCGPGRSLFVKQPPTLSGLEIDYLRREATCYRMAYASDDTAASILAGLLPGWLDYDARHHCLLTELLPGSTLMEYQRRWPSQLPLLSRRLGEGLAALHSRTVHSRAVRERSEKAEVPRTAPFEASEPSAFPRQLPWILLLPHAAGAGPVTTGGTVQMVQWLRAHPNLTNHLDHLAADWRIDSLIHGDIKWENCIIVASAEANPEAAPVEGPAEVRLIDWELADLGDSAWDVGAALHAYLVCWVFSMPHPHASGLGQLPMYALTPLQDLQPSALSFWNAYCQGRGWAPASTRPRLLRALRYGAGRLLQTTYEHLLASPGLTPHALLMLQTAVHILQHTDHAAQDLLAL